jgi:hypothetical protein
VKLQIRGAAVGAASPSGGVDVRLDLANGDRLCASFAPGDIVKDQPGTLVGRNATAPADCGTTTSTTTSTVTTTSTTSTTSTTVVLAPCGPGPGPLVCGNACPDGLCMDVPTFSNPQLSECLCVPQNVVPCSANGNFPTCNGACAAGETCAPFVFDTGSTLVPVCACVSSSAVCGPAGSSCAPGLCTDGNVCTDAHLNDPSFCGCGVLAGGGF